RNPVNRSQGISAWLHLYLFPDPNGRSGDRRISIEDIADAFQKGSMSTKSYSVPMDAVYSSGLGFCARQAGSTEARILGLTAEIRYDGWVSFCVPINVLPANRLSNEYDSLAEFIEILRSSNHQDVPVADLSSLSVSVIALLNQLLHLKDAVQDHRDLYAGFEVSGIQGVIPYVDSSSYLTRIKRFGLPVSHIENHRFPAGDPNIETLVELEYPPYDDSNDLHRAGARSLILAGPLLNLILAVTGATAGVDDIQLEDFRLNRHSSKD
ncbi:MAG: hypothetical protein AAFQ62_10610, partial [Pseudomonadota bacterium]